MIAAQAVRLLPDLLLPQRPRGFRSDHYAFSTAGETRLGFSRDSMAAGIDLPVVAAEIRRRTDAFLASQSGPASSLRDRLLLPVLALLDMMTSNDERRLVLSGSDLPVVAAYGASHGLDVRLVSGSESEAPPADDAEHTLLALDLPLRDVAAYAANPRAVKGIVVAPLSERDAVRSIAARFPTPPDDIPTGVDLGTGMTVAWIWPRL